MRTINLLWLDTGLPSFEWKLGAMFCTEPNPQAVHRLLEEKLEVFSADAWLFWESSLGMPDPDLVTRLFDTPGDVWHAGLKLGLEGQPELLKYVAAHWMFIVDPPKDTEAVSWRLSLNCCLVRTEILKSFGLPSALYRGLHGSGLELGFRFLRLGAIVKYVPELTSGFEKSIDALSFEDQIRFIDDTYGDKWAQWCLINSLAKKPISTVKTLITRCHRPKHAISEPAVREIPIYCSSQSISVVLPTLNRYDYLPGCLDSLRKQTLKPIEIIVIDQNPPEQRRPDIYSSFSDLPIKVIWQEETGQCKARNAAVLASTGEWLFFADDDSIYPPNTIERHWSAVQTYRCAGSSRLSLPPREYIVPKEYRYFRIAYNFDTGNCLVNRSVIIQAGGFDLNYDYGKGADQDLGMRIYLNGGVIIHNPLAQRIHYKAAGGLREYGVLWNNRSLGPTKVRPPVTTVYYFYRYLQKPFIPQAIFQAIIFAYIPSSQVNKSRLQKILKAFIKEILVLPQTISQVRKSKKFAKKMLSEGPKLITR